jgi:hypothetical protein
LRWPHRELTVAARTAALPWLRWRSWQPSTAFVLTWAPGVPMAAPMNLYDQSRALHWALLAVRAAMDGRAMRPGRSDRCRGLMARAGSDRACKSRRGKDYGFAPGPGRGHPHRPACARPGTQAAAVPVAGVTADLLPLFGLARLIAAASTAAILLASDELRA